MSTELTKLQHLMLFVLDDTVDYFSVNPLERRCSLPGGGCFYSPLKALKPTSDGCAIGRYQTPEQQDRSTGPVRNLKQEDIPVILQALSMTFLRHIQILHDNHVNWTNTGLSDSGRREVSLIRAKIIANSF